MTSHDCVLRLRSIFKTRKIGHTGTLDPEVEGVLGICIGRATKLVPYLTKGSKTYIAEVTLGSSTETEDASGKIIEKQQVDPHPTAEEINQTLQLFTGEITQIPPMYSAIRVNGKRLYEYARANEDVERPKRQVTIHSIKQIGAYVEQMASFSIQVTCSEGTYIRTLCVDIGAQLGYPAHMSALVRTKASTFTEKQAISFATLKEAEERGKLDQFLYPLRYGLGEMEQVEVDAKMRQMIYHGNKLPTPSHVRTFPFAYIHQEELLAIYDKHPTEENVVKPVRVFN